MLAANTKAQNPSQQGAGCDDTFEDRFPQPQFSDRFPTASESLPQISREVALAPPQRTVRTEPAAGSRRWRPR